MTNRKKKIITVYGIDNCGKNTLIRLLEGAPDIRCSVEDSLGSPKSSIINLYTDFNISIRDAFELYKNQLVFKESCTLYENYINYAFLIKAKESCILSKSTGIHHPKETLSKDINVLYQDYVLKQINISRNITIAFFTTFYNYIERGEGTFSEVLDAYVKELVDDNDKFEYARLNFLNIEHTDLINPNKRDCILESFYQYIEEDNTIFTTTYNQFNTAANKWITEHEKSQLKQASEKYNLEECYTKIYTVMLKKFPDTQIIPYDELSTYI
jgi:hypothetical protein